MSFNDCMHLEKTTGNGLASCRLSPATDYICPYGSKEKAKDCCPKYFSPAMLYEDSTTYYDVEPSKEHPDNVNHPSHYVYGKYECIDVIYDILDGYEDPISAWLTGQIIKYMWRWPHKNGLEDLKKTQFYLNKLVEHEEQKNG